VEAVLQKKEFNTSVLFCLILLTAFAVRAYYFVGLVFGDPQDDGIYYNYAMDIYKNGLLYLEKYKDMPQDYMANPVHQFYFRSMVIYPVALFFKCFGPSEHSASIWCFLCSMLSLIVAFYLGKLLYSETTGILAAFLLAIFPLNVISSTRIISDVPLAFFTSLAILFFCYADKEEKKIFYFLSGVSLGLGYLAKITEVVVLCIFLLFCLFKVLKKRVFIKNLLFLLGGFLLVIFLEGCFYYYTVGKPFMNYYIHHTACMFKYMSEFIMSFSVGPINVMYTNGTPIYHLKHVFNVNSGDVSFFGYFYFLFFISIIYSLYKRRNYFLIFFSLLMFVFLEFGFVGMKFDVHERKLEYLMIFKQQRFLTLLTVPLMVVSSYFLLELSKKSKLLVFTGVLFLVITSFVSINKTYAFYRSGLEDLRAVTTFVQEKKDNIFFGDLWAVHQIKIFAKYKVENLKVINKNTKKSDLCDSFVIMGGSRGVGLSAEYVLSTLPSFVWNVLASGENPENWVLMEERNGKRSYFRRYNLKIYYVPCL